MEGSKCGGRETNSEVSSGASDGDTEKESFNT